MRDFCIVRVSEIVNTYQLNVWPHVDCHERTDRFPVIEIDATPEALDNCRISMPKPALISRIRERVGLTYHHQPLVPFAAYTTGSGIRDEMEVALVRTVPSVALIFFTLLASREVQTGDRITLTEVKWKRTEQATTEAAWFRKMFVPPHGMMWGQEWWRAGFPPTV